MPFALIGAIVGALLVGWPGLSWPEVALLILLCAAIGGLVGQAVRWAEKRRVR
jgi:hypothetical protein